MINCAVYIYIYIGPIYINFWCTIQFRHEKFMMYNYELGRGLM